MAIVRKRPFLRVYRYDPGHWRWTCLMCQTTGAYHVGAATTWRGVFDYANHHAKERREQHEWAVANIAEARSRFGQSKGI
jgi:hypothetical protein